MTGTATTHNTCTYTPMLVSDDTTRYAPACYQFGPMDAVADAMPWSRRFLLSLSRFRLFTQRHSTCQFPRSGVPPSHVKHILCPPDHTEATGPAAAACQTPRRPLLIQPARLDRILGPFCCPPEPRPRRRLVCPACLPVSECTECPTPGPRHALPLWPPRLDDATFGSTWRSIWN